MGYLYNENKLVQTGTGNINLTSDYVFRGVSLSDNGPAVQGGFDYSVDLLKAAGVSGYLGVWGSNVDFNETVELIRQARGEATFVRAAEGNRDALATGAGRGPAPSGRALPGCRPLTPDVRALRGGSPKKACRIWCP